MTLPPRSLNPPSLIKYDQHLIPEALPVNLNPLLHLIVCYAFSPNTVALQVLKMYGGDIRKGMKHGYDHYYQSDFRPDYRVKEVGSHRDDRENHVLLITVINPAFPITCVSLSV